MNYIIDGIFQGLKLLFPPEKKVIEIVLLSLIVSGSATCISSIFSIPAGIFLAINEFKLKPVILIILKSLLSIPSILIGLFIYLLLTRQGPLGKAGLLFTPYAIIIAQAILATPIITVLTYSGLKSFAKDVKDISYTLGANKLQTMEILFKEGKLIILVAIITGFSRVIGETGMTLMVGGNIKGLTRVMTTAIAVETMKGNFELSIALGVVLFVVSIIINILLHIFQKS